MMNLRKKDYMYFAIIFGIIFILSFSLLYALGFVPEALLSDGGAPANIVKTAVEDQAINQPETSSRTPVPNIKDVPVKIVIPNAGVNISISDPNTTDDTILNNYLTKGAVRYPGSGYSGEGNLYLFGHSSTLAVVHNPAYRAFNNINTLKAGDEIYVYSATEKYTYKVRDVALVKAANEEVDFSTTENMLTLSTCDLLSANPKEERYLLHADFVGKEAI